MSSSASGHCAVEYQLSGYYELSFPLSSTGTVPLSSQEMS